MASSVGKPAAASPRGSASQAKKVAPLPVLKRPASAQQSQSAQVLKKPAAGDLRSLVCPLSTCPVPFCKGQLFQPNETHARAKVYGSETVEEYEVPRLVCAKCRSTVRPNYYKNGSQKLNCLSLEQMQDLGVYFVNSRRAFTMSFLELSYLRLLRSKQAPGQEACVQKMWHQSKDPDETFTQHQMRQDLLSALEGFAAAKRAPKDVQDFEVEHPADKMNSKRESFLFKPEHKVRALTFDGHFGIHRVLDEAVDGPRVVSLRGRPRTKKYKQHERTATCANKEKAHVALPNRTAGWQFVLDPDSCKCCGASEHIQNECLPDKVEIVEDVLGMENVEPDILIHDDNCTFETHVRKNKRPKFRRIKYFVIDKFHRGNHRCKKRTLTREETKRCKKLRTNMSESFNAWMRRLNFFLNGLNPASHRFWVWESISFYNEHLEDIPFEATPRKNVEARKRPAAGKERVQVLRPAKRPAAKFCRRPACKCCKN